MAFKDFEELEKSFHAAGKKTVAVAAAQDKSALTAVRQCRKEGLVDAILIGDEALIREEIKAFDGDFDDCEIIDAKTLEEAAQKTCQCVRDGKADFILKGKIDTGILLKAVVKEENGLRTGKLMSHLAFLKIPNYHKLIVLTDSGMVLYPTLEQKKEIIENAVENLCNMGYDTPKVGLLAAIEKVNPKQPETVDAAALTEMYKNGEITGCIVEGPLSYDILMSRQSAHKKGFDSELVGDADVLVVPDMPCGNILGKALLFSAGADMAGLIVGAKVPIALTSRGATEKEKRQSLLLAAACAKGDK
ncbi:bifunctional enoyl-CoA hydratase/phosphate acetyltransferase [Anaerotruncus sp. 80]|uniref:Bifunctional enoyl-CoA hydratase/phosphate acetyltransferase n=1 Tax=Anaerotruncus colihominis TaxID=169435 RepID=A0A845QHY7_9FIRM|nr:MULTISPECIES: bifunctional enoyl-CoA hydratase/phosphate acetyltransferase [Anaerotruncus]NBH61740.1 bifunctional enoyl-CoA hydratase/phosphate acetyltransferase [Anaerotruncus colihominis]NCF02395.1 bifunctional enoyl-CoA hydratase/phosphate acetyltransferase [Anaerotruncus sp. 80]